MTADDAPSATVRGLFAVFSGGANHTPADVAPFSAALFDALDRASGESSSGAISADRVSEIFDFEHFPSASKYIDLAAKEPGCVRP
jgi:hypothetical protein